MGSVWKCLKVFGAVVHTVAVNVMNYPPFGYFRFVVSFPYNSMLASFKVAAVGLLRSHINMPVVNSSTAAAIPATPPMIPIARLESNAFSNRPKIAKNTFCANPMIWLAVQGKWLAAELAWASAGVVGVAAQDAMFLISTCPLASRFTSFANNVDVSLFGHSNSFLSGRLIPFYQRGVFCQ